MFVWTLLCRIAYSNLDIKWLSSADPGTEPFGDPEAIAPEGLLGPEFPVAEPLAGLFDGLSRAPFVTNLPI